MVECCGGWVWWVGVVGVCGGGCNGNWCNGVMEIGVMAMGVMTGAMTGAMAWCNELA